MTPRTGGPAGNAVLTAWTGLILLVLSVAELSTLLNLSGLISWHVVIGVALVPMALLKTASTGWRILRYYTGDRRYRRAGPPPLLLRVLGPLVVVSTLTLLGSGVVMVAAGPEASRRHLVTLAGHPLSLVTVHAALALGWAAVTGLHVLGRLAAALLIVAPRRIPWAVPEHRQEHVPGAGPRRVIVLGTVLLAGLAFTLVLPVNANWRHGDHHRQDAQHAPRRP